VFFPLHTEHTLKKATYVAFLFLLWCGLMPSLQPSPTGEGIKPRSFSGWSERKNEVFFPLHTEHTLKKATHVAFCFYVYAMFQPSKTARGSSLSLWERVRVRGFTT
jgi:hypothetical protein